MATTVYLLIAITAGGSVSYSTFTTLQECDEAKSLALYGETVEQYQTKDSAYTRSMINYTATFYAAHPPRPPKNDEEVKAVAEEKQLRAKGAGTASTVWSPCMHGTVCGRIITSDFLIQDTPGISGNGMSPSYDAHQGEWVQFVHHEFRLRYATDVKTAECIKTEEP